jgi:transcriptional regulator with XRE-family HTH domain
MNSTLGDFLQSRRARIQPADVGLPPFRRRRVPGLRREEVAQLAGMSVDYYIRLEQGRSNHVSDQVLDSVARVLRLDATEQAHLRDLARPERGRRAARASRPAGSSERVRPGVRLLLDSITHSPALVVGPRMDVLAWNALGDAVHELAAKGRTRNMARRAFLDLDASSFYPDWPAVAAETVAYLRFRAGRHPDDEQLTALIGELCVKSGEFRRLWADHLVKEKTHGLKRINHPIVGELQLGYETLALPGVPDQTIIVYTAPPGSATAERLAMLASWTASERTATRPADAETRPPSTGPGRSNPPA